MSAKTTLLSERTLCPDEQLESAARKRTLRSCLGFASWRFSLAAGGICSWLVYLVNLSVTVYALKTKHIDYKGRSFIYEGQCATVKKFNIAIHLAINIFGTILLSASNYCMQCLSAPTRREIELGSSSKDLVTYWPS
ncbi:hypothetical protein K469DRAFT_147508 [Zopfia rhizophila CBS 207.26]|uniref:DUF6536 domain-containing protein n=1 Tax=Zopfia rhizophila CBS 207.26 TaxID=1314779 RepID=A0A6A6E2M8_9PEZI|nr:hypothetical protein K469DRAFT_147508 [Zopfia rhizophila CBS 207.26]